MLDKKTFQNNDNKITSMQYPYDSSGTNKLFDGTAHDIIPEKLAPIELGIGEFYVMEYYDITMETEAITLLTKIWNQFVKVPLDNYDILMKYLEKNNIMAKASTKISLPPIKLAQTMQAQTLIQPYANANSKIPAYKFNEYVPLKNDGTINITSGTFTRSCVILEPYSDTETYLFDKAPRFDIKNREIQNGAQNSQINESGGYRYEFGIYVPEGTVGIETSVSTDGSIRQQEVLMVPGIHEYTITYALCKDMEDYSAAQMANTMSIKATWPKYNDFQDTDIAFCDGCSKKLPLEFYNADGKRLNDVGRKYF